MKNKYSKNLIRHYMYIIPIGDEEGGIKYISTKTCALYVHNTYIHYMYIYACMYVYIRNKYLHYPKG